jgi:hypothetical protein
MAPAILAHFVRCLAASKPKGICGTNALIFYARLPITNGSQPVVHQAGMAADREGPHHPEFPPGDADFRFKMPVSRSEERADPLAVVLFFWPWV